MLSSAQYFSLLDCLRIPSCIIRKFALLSVSRTNFPSARCPTAANLECNDVDIFSKQIRTLNRFYACSSFADSNVLCNLLLNISYKSIFYFCPVLFVCIFVFSYDGVLFNLC
jgi:hypothetical protein